MNISGLLHKLVIASRQYQELLRSGTISEEYPETVSGLLINLDASKAGDKTLNGTEVTAWRNRGVLGGVVRPHAGETGPTNLPEEQNGLDVVRFSWNPCFLDRYLNTTDMTIFLVGASTREAGDLGNAVDTVLDARQLDGTFDGLSIQLFNYFVDDDERKGYFFANGLLNAEYFKNGTFFPYPNNPVISENERCVLGARLYGATLGPDVAEIQIGRDANPDFNAEMEIMQLLIYSRILPDHIFATVNAFLQQKWGIL